MAKFILKISAWILVILLTGTTIAWLAIKKIPEQVLLDPDAYFMLKHQYKMAGSQGPYRNIIIGDSRGNAAIAPKLLGEKWLNLSISGGDFYEGYLTVKHFLEKNTIDTLVMLYGISYIETGSAWFDRYTVPMQFASNEEMNDFEKVENSRKMEYHGSNRIGAVPRFIKQAQRRLLYHHIPLLYMNAASEGIFSYFKNKEEVKAKKEKMESRLTETRGHICFGDATSCAAVSITDPDRKFNQNLFQIIYLDSIMQTGRRNHTVIYFGVAPLNQGTYVGYGNSLYDRTSRDYLKKLPITYPGLHVLVDSAGLPNNLFGDPWHLNESGTLVYTQLLTERLKH